MEPERQIEKVLRIFAKKRREQAGPPLELHPVDRRLLQDEVARQTSKPKGRSFFLTWLVARPRLSFILCVVALSAVGLWFVLPLFTPAKNRSMRVVQGNRFEMEERAGGPSQPATPPARTPAESDSALKKETVDQLGRDADSEDKKRGETSNFELARSDNRRQSSPATVAPSAATSPVPGEKLAVSISNSDFQNETRLAQIERAINPAAMTNAIVLADGNGPARARENQVPQKQAGESEAIANGPVGGGGGFGGGAGSPVRFQRIANQPVPESSPIPVQTRSADSFSNLSVATGVGSNATLLDSFAVEQNGRDLKVIDHDGSVYRGYLQFGESPALDSPAVQVKETADLKAATGTVARAGPAPGWSFRVSGTNLSLKQNIVFIGNLFVRTNESAFGLSSTATVNGGGAIGGQTGDSLQLLIRNSRINGTVLIENTGKLEIIAAPVSR